MLPLQRLFPFKTSGNYYLEMRCRSRAYSILCLSFKQHRARQCTTTSLRAIPQRQFPICAAIFRVVNCHQLTRLPFTTPTHLFQGGFSVEQTAVSKTRAFAVPTPFRETSLYDSIRGAPHLHPAALFPHAPLPFVLLTHLHLAVKYQGEAASHHDGVYESQHSLGPHGAPMGAYGRPHPAHRGYMHEAGDDQYAYAPHAVPEAGYDHSGYLSSSFLSQSSSGASVGAHAYGHRAAAPSLDHGG